MGKATLTAPLYVSIAWTLMITYQLFTQTAVTTVVTYIGMLWPSVGAWLASRLEMIVLIYAFAWVFVLSSAIPSIILGKERSVLAQFFVCLMVTLVAFAIQDALTIMRGGGLVGQIFRVAVLFNNAFLAIIYLSIPYLLMLMLDVRLRGKPAQEYIGRLENSSYTTEEYSLKDFRVDNVFRMEFFGDFLSYLKQEGINHVYFDRGIHALYFLHPSIENRVEAVIFYYKGNARAIWFKVKKVSKTL